jgi:glucose-6-phosphate dehydrogenase assembly protein OpcA
MQREPLSHESEARVQYTIEARHLTSESTHRPIVDRDAQRTTIEAATEDDAITKFARERACELVSLSKPLHGRESFATIRKDDSVFLVRVYAA